MLLFILLIIIAIILVRWKYRQFIALSKVLKHDLLSFPILGISYMFLGNNEAHMKTLQIFGRESIKQDGIFFCWLGYLPYVVVSDPDIADFLSKACLEKGKTTATLRIATGNSSIFAPVEIWRPRRRVLLPTFASKNLKQFVNIFNEQSRVLVDQLRPTTGKPFAVFDYFSKCTMDIVAHATMGIELGAQKTSGTHPFVHAISNGTRMLAERYLQPWLYSDFVYKLLPRYKTLMKYRDYAHEKAREMLNIRRKRLQEKYSNVESLRMKSFSELMSEFSGGEQGYTDLELREEGIVLLIAGTDTTAMSLGFTALMLAKYPEMQEKIHEELMQVFSDESQPVTPEHLPQLKYLEAVIKEALRLYTPVPLIVRETTEDTMLPSGVVLPKGCGIFLHLWAINRNPRYWGADAEDFRPERFLEGSLKHPSQFTSFSLGPRNCVGFKYAMMMLQTIFATLLRHYRVLPADPTTVHEPIRVKYGMMMKAVDNFRIQLEPRN